MLSLGLLYKFTPQSIKAEELFVYSTKQRKPSGKKKKTTQNTLKKTNLEFIDSLRTNNTCSHKIKNLNYYPVIIYIEVLLSISQSFSTKVDLFCWTDSTIGCLPSLTTKYSELSTIKQNNYQIKLYHQFLICFSQGHDLILFHLNCFFLIMTKNK